MNKTIREEREGITSMSDCIKRKDIKKSRTLDRMKQYNFPSKYIGDNEGNVYVLVNTKKESNCYRKMKPFITRDGYVEFVLNDVDGNKKHIQAQRIVASLFIPNPLKKKHVNHKNGNRKDNREFNLEWNTVSENALHSYRVLGKVPHNKKKR